MKIIVMSCDKNTDTFEPFHHCIEKYWPEHPEVIYSTETVVNPYYKTICKDYSINEWTKRIRETVELFDDTHFLLMCDDIFIRERVNNDSINDLCKIIKDNIAVVSLNISCGTNETAFNADLVIRNGKWQLSLSDSIWSKEAILDLFDYDTDPWTFEINNRIKDYICLAAKNNYFINRGSSGYAKWFALHRGKWCWECKEFFDKEGIVVDYSKRGFYDGPKNIKYVLMCGGNYDRHHFKLPKQLLKVKGERVLDRTIRLLKQNGVNEKDIIISSNNPIFDQFGLVRVENQKNNWVQSGDFMDKIGYWLDAFYPMNEPCCYIFGDVYYSDDAMKQIVSTITPDYLMFGTNVNIAKNKPIKKWDEPLAFKVTNQKPFRDAINTLKGMWDRRETRRHPLVWELYRYMTGYDVNVHKIGDNYISINDYSTDVDSEEDIKLIEAYTTTKKTPIKKETKQATFMGGGYYGL